jgi:hypothetical protein
MIVPGQVLEISVNDFGGAPVAEHNMPCAVCRSRHAVLVLDKGVFEPCWECQSRGWQLKQRRGALYMIGKILRR